MFDLTTIQLMNYAAANAEVYTESWLPRDAIQSAVVLSASEDLNRWDDREYLRRLDYVAGKPKGPVIG